MAKSTTEQKAESQDRKIIQEIGFKDFSAVCQEYQIIEKATRELLELAKKEDTPIKVKVDIYKWVIEMNIGKPKQQDIKPLGEENKKSVAFVEYISAEKAMSELINKVGGLENIIQALREKGYQDIPDIDEFYEVEKEDQIKDIEDMRRIFSDDISDLG